MSVSRNGALEPGTGRELLRRGSPPKPGAPRTLNHRARNCSTWRTTRVPLTIAPETGDEHVQAQRQHPGREEQLGPRGGSQRPPREEAIAYPATTSHLGARRERSRIVEVASVNTAAIRIASSTAGGRSGDLQPIHRRRWRRRPAQSCVTIPAAIAAATKSMPTNKRPLPRKTVRRIDPRPRRGALELGTVDLGEDAEDADHLITPEERLRVAMARQ